MDHSGKNTILRDVHLLTERIKDVAVMKGDGKVCLQGIDSDVTAELNYRRR